MKILKGIFYVSAACVLVALVAGIFFGLYLLINILGILLGIFLVIGFVAYLIADIAEGKRDT